MKKPKIFHIGGAHSVHLANLVKELDKLGYPQCVLSYRKESILPKKIPVYVFNYQKFFPNKSFPKDEQALTTYISSILKKERPSILHGHFLIFSFMAINLAKDISNLPLYLTPWSARALTNDKILYGRINKSIANCKYFLTASSWVFSLFQKHYYKSLKNNMHVNWRLPLYLDDYHSLQKGCKEVTSPKILSARVMQDANHQDLLVYALPEIFIRYPNSTATFIIGQSASQGNVYFNKMIELARSLGVYNKCNFIGRSLAQDEFSDLIKKHNIIYSVSDSDTEGSQTTYQAVYSGAITLVKNSIYGYDLLIPDKNLLTVDLTKEDVLNKLVYSIGNLQELSDKFFDNSRQLKYASNEYMLPILTKLYDREIIK